MRLTSEGAQPVDAQLVEAGTFARLMAPFVPFATDPVLAVAVAGGRDSLARALLTPEWARAAGGLHVVRARSAGDRGGGVGMASLGWLATRSGGRRKRKTREDDGKLDEKKTAPQRRPVA